MSSQRITPSPLGPGGGGPATPPGAERLPGSPRQGWAGSGQGCACRRPTLHHRPRRCLGSPGTLPAPAAPGAERRRQNHSGTRCRAAKGGPRSAAFGTGGQHGGADGRTHHPWDRERSPTRPLPRCAAAIPQPIPAPAGNCSAGKVLRQPPLLSGRRDLSSSPFDVVGRGAGGEKGLLLKKWPQGENCN